MQHFEDLLGLLIRYIDSMLSTPTTVHLQFNSLTLLCVQVLLASNAKRQEYKTFSPFPLSNKLLSLGTGKTTEMINASFSHLYHNEDCPTLSDTGDMAYLMDFYFRNVLENLKT